MADNIGRARCLVPFCKRSWKSDGDDAEGICGDHYRMASKTTRKRLSKLQRMIRALDRKYDPATAPAEVISRMDKLMKLEAMAWSRMKRQAIEAAGGIG